MSQSTLTYQIFPRLSIPTGSDIYIQSGSIFPYSIPSTYVIFSGSIPGFQGPYYAVNAANNTVLFNGSDPTNVIQSAMYSLTGSSLFGLTSASGSGGTILIRAGPIYRLTGSLVPVSGVTLRGEGGKNFDNDFLIGTVLRLGLGTNAYMFSGSTWTVGFSIRDMLLDCNATAPQTPGTGSGAYVAPSKRVVFNNVTFYNCLTDAIIFQGISSNDFGNKNKVIDCIFQENQGKGIKTVN